MSLVRRLFALGASVALVVAASSSAHAYPRPGRTVLASVGVQSPSQYTELLPAITSDGHFVAFVSEADGVIAEDANGFSDVFVRDLVTGQTELVSVSSDGVPGNGSSHGPAISADGRYVVVRRLGPGLPGLDLRPGNLGRDIGPWHRPLAFCAHAQR